MNNDKEQQVKQPSVEAQQLYLSLINNDADVVEILRTKKKYKIRWMKHGQIEKLTKLLVKNAGDKLDISDAIIEDGKIACKAAAIIILDGYWKLKFWYWLVWRWFYYVEQYDDIQLQKLLEIGKKKVPQNQFYVTIMSLTEAKDSLMRMRAKEVEAILRAPSTERPSQTGSSDNGL